jgi:hypothetical protein
MKVNVDCRIFECNSHRPIQEDAWKNPVYFEGSKV